MKRVLVRSNNKIIAGVCGGIAEYLGWDPAAFRVLFFLVSIISAAFPGTIVYILLWILMPSPYKYLYPHQEKQGDRENRF